MLFPAWLPRASASGVDLENSAVELLQVALLMVSTAFLVAGSAHARRFKPIYRALALGCLAAAIGESPWLEGILGLSEEWILLPIFGTIIWLLVKNPRETLRYIGLSARQPASGFIAAAIVIIYVFANFFGSQRFWEASLEEAVPEGLPDICSAYLELLGCYFIFVGVIGLILPLRKNRDKENL